MIDWDLAAAGTPGAEFAWYLAHGARRIDATHEEIEADHRAGQISDEDYRAVVGSLRRDAADALRALDRLRPRAAGTSDAEAKID